MGTRQVTAAADEYGHPALSRTQREIRTIRLKRVNLETIEYDLSVEKLSESPMYCALSYSWGATVPSASLKGIVINGITHKIRPTLYFFLRTVAKHCPEKSMWVDSICINQTNNQEQNHQVAMMGDIYESAQEVYAWLGVGDDDTQYAFQHLAQHADGVPVDNEMFSMCAEQVFGASYWTRRWVIQEFALAKMVFIVCGESLSTWYDLTSKVDMIVLRNSITAQKALASFNGVRVLSHLARLPLLDLMERFDSARCTDRRDKALALRSIAIDGQRLLPDYSESVGDVCFRLMSMRPAHRIKPEIYGYRWPDGSMIRVLKCMQATGGDCLDSLKSSLDDRLFVTFDYVGVVTNAKLMTRGEANDGQHEDEQQISMPLSFGNLSHTINTDGAFPGPLMGNSDLRPDDLVYSLQTTLGSPAGLYLAFRRSGYILETLGVLIDQTVLESSSYWAKFGVFEETITLIKSIVCRGVMACARNSIGPKLQKRLFCHINRPMMLLLWSLHARKAHDFVACQQVQAYQVVQQPMLCSCMEKDENAVHPSMTPRKLGKHHIETLPLFNASKAQDFRNVQFTELWNAALSDQSHNQANVLDEGEKSEDRHKYSVITSYDHERPQLSFAAGEGHVLFVEYFISNNDRGIDLEDANGRTPLCHAAAGGHRQVLTMILGTNRVDCNHKDAKGQTSLILAASHGHEKVVQVLLKASNVDPTITNEFEQTPLSLAAALGHDKVVQVLLDSDVNDVNYYDRKGYTTVLRAAANGHEGVIRVLLNSDKIDFAARTPDGCTALMLAAKNGHEGVVKILLDDSRCDLDSTDPWGWPAYFLAASNGHIEVVQVFFDGNKVDPNYRNLHSQTALLLAAANGQNELVRWLLNTGKINAKMRSNGDPQSALHSAASNGHHEVIKSLLESGQMLPDYGSHPAMIEACHNGHLECARVLINAGACVNQKDESCPIPLRIAAANNFEDMARLLLENGADVDPKKQGVVSPLLEAIGNHNETMVQLLVEHGADLKYESARYGLPLHEAIRRGHEGIVRYLLYANPDVKWKKGDFKHVLREASDKGYTAVVELVNEYLIANDLKIAKKKDGKPSSLATRLANLARGR